ncbi:queuosine precursor transporter [Cupriavidus taiwanensis]|uniref:queuosine precursor transporter n=1 Tax=Cupriavidus taiwanensis TaxID=164546 RepID=UPI0015725F4A|nr:queuosine precursor transporter [Cupriavidus taiwanensis]NSX16544.1 queuosine precursor transporter [Cupriavidus taiwanensis]
MSASPASAASALQAGRVYRYYDFVMVAFVTVLLCSNLIGAAKAAQVTLPLIGTVTFGAGVLFFPISYIFGDVLTEVYGYGRDRRVVWAGFAALAFATFMSVVVLNMPVAPFMADYQKSLQDVFGNTWRIALGSLIAFCCGSFTNSYVLAKMKLWTAGRWLWTRTIGSTLAGELVDSSLFYVIAFYGIWPLEQVIQVAVAQYVLKTGWEVVMTPVTYKVVGFLKRAENEDYFDRHTNFTPFRVRV